MFLAALLLPGLSLVAGFVASQVGIPPRDGLGHWQKQLEGK